MLALLQMFNSLFFHLLSPASLLLLAFCSVSEKKYMLPSLHMEFIPNNACLSVTPAHNLYHPIH